MKSKKYYTHEEVKAELMKDPGFRKAYEALEPEFRLRGALINARQKQGLTQAEIARRAGTTQSAIARFESQATNPTLEFMQRLAAAVGADLEVRFVTK